MKSPLGVKTEHRRRIARREPHDSAKRRISPPQGREMLDEVRRVIAFDRVHARARECGCRFRRIVARTEHILWRTDRA